MRAAVILAALTSALTLAGHAQTNVFAMPQLQQRHLRLVQQMQLNARQQDFAAMEATCRAGTALMPQDPTWRYNLACALARQNRVDEALGELAKAVEFGFRDGRSLVSDPDLQALRGSVRFDAIVDTVRQSGDRPPAHAPVVRPAPARNGVVTITASNTVWNFDLGCFQSYIAFPTNSPAPTNPVIRVSSPAGRSVSDWYAAGTAAGHAGDCYDNRDRGHSRLDLRQFPGMTAIRYDEEARRHNVDNGLSSFFHTGAVVLGNSSTALTAGPFWRSNARMAYVDGRAISLLLLQYLRNGLYVYPEHRDYDADHHGDVFPANTPYLLISKGSSGSDQPFLAAIACTLAAFQPATKARLTREGLLMPTVQMMLRASQKGITNRTEYLSGKAHPVVFDSRRLDVERMVAMAHDLASNAVPPLVVLRTREDDRPVAGRDFFDGATSEGLFDSPAAIARVVRGMAYTRRMVIDASGSRDPQGRPLQWHWVVLQGNPASVTIRPTAPDGSAAEIRVDYPGGDIDVPADPGMHSRRVDIGVFADNGISLSAPAFVTFHYLANEIRTYDDSKRIQAVDYAAAAGRYADPQLSLPKRWRDEYEYTPDGRLIGWTRIAGNDRGRYTWDGCRVEKTDSLGRPATGRVMRYLPRSGGEEGTDVPEIVPVEGDVLRTYRYASGEDRIGTVASETRAGP